MRMLPAPELLDPEEEKTVVVFSDASNAAVDGTSAPDTIVVRGGDDTVSGFGGDDFVFGVGEANLLYGDSTVAEGPDAGTGSDILVGGAGDDTLWGGAGADTLQGGGGADTFSFGFVPQARLPVLDTGALDGPHDLVVDFSRAEGDAIDLSAYRSIYPELPTVFLGNGAFTSAESLQVRYEVRDGYTAVQFQAPTSDDPSTPRALTGQIDLAGAVDLMADDFVLTNGAAGPGLGQALPTQDADWNALAAQATANFEATGQWLL